MIVCEEDTEFDEKVLKNSRTDVVYVEDQSQLTPEFLTDLELMHNPEEF